MTNKTAWTPGDWSCPHGSRVYGADGRLVAVTSFEHRGTSETEANAQLIALAPEMAGALRLCEDRLGVLIECDNEDHGGASPDDVNAWRACRAILARLPVAK